MQGVAHGIRFNISWKWMSSLSTDTIRSRAAALRRFLMCGYFRRFNRYRCTIIYTQ